MFKKTFLVILLSAFVFSLAACTKQEAKSDSEILLDIKNSLTFENTEISEDITIPTIEEDGVIVQWVSSDPTYLEADGTVHRPAYYQTDQNVSLTVALELNDKVITKVFDFVVLKEDVPEDLTLNTDFTDSLTLDFAYEGKSFIDDGVGEVTLTQCVDGDTAHFTDGVNNFSVRFLGINTPESTAKFEPWGKAASHFTCEKLENAQHIVLQADPAAGRMDNYNERWLAWVWYDGRLLNLELLEQAYTKPTGGIDTLYGKLLYDVSLQVKYTNRRVWGEIDPDFDYSREGIQLTIEELVKNPSEYVGKKVSIHGIVTRRVGAAVFLQEGDYGIYLYNRVSFTPNLTIGNEVVVSGVTVTYYPDEETGAVQISGYQERENYSTVLSTGNSVEPTIVQIADLTDLSIGKLLQIEHLTVKSVYTSVDSFTVTAEDQQGNTITIRKDSSASSDITSDMFVVGSKITVIAPLSRYQSRYQLVLSSVDDIINE
jgi:micrococcal nuclease